MSDAQRAIELEREISELKETLAQLEEQKEALELKNWKTLNSLFEKIDSLDSWSNVIKDIADLPGVRQPKWYKVTVPFEYGDRQEAFSTVEISPTGPFVCTQMQAYYKIMDTNPLHYPYYYDGDTQDPTIVRTTTAAGRMISSTSYFGLRNREFETYGAGGFRRYPRARFIGELYSNYNDGTIDFIGEGWSYPELDIRIQTASNNSFWTGTKSIPAASLYGVEGPLYMGEPGIVKATDRLVVFAKPTNGTMNLKGEFILEFHGYQINAHLNLENLLGV